MPITEAQRIERKQWIGSSDAAAILGLSPWRTPMDVWLDKTGQLQDDATSAAADAGNRLEPAILDYAQEQLGELRQNVTVHAPGLPIASNLDAQLVAGGNPVEAKTAGLFIPGGISKFDEEWGEFGSDEIPHLYIIQCQVHLLCTQREVCHVAALLAGRGFGMFTVTREERLIARIAEQCQEFWESNVKLGIPPKNSTVSIEVAKRIRRTEGKVCQLPIEAVEDWQKAVEARKAAAQAEDAAKAVLLTCMGDSEIGDSVLGRVTFTETHRKSYTVAESISRTLRFKAAKKA